MCNSVENDSSGQSGKCDKANKKREATGEQRGSVITSLKPQSANREKIEEERLALTRTQRSIINTPLTNNAKAPPANMRYVETASMPPGGQAFSIMPYGHIMREVEVESRITTICAAMLTMPAAMTISRKQLMKRTIFEPRESVLRRRTYVAAPRC